MVNITDIKWYDPRFSRDRVGYYMDEFLTKNLMGIPDYLDKSYDVVGIVSGHGKVRVGKSTIAQQVAYYIAWMIAGGKMEQDIDTGRFRITKTPKNEIRFSIEENIVFTPEDLQRKARELFHKYGRNQVLVYDEGRAGMDSAASMSSINKAVADFFQECGQYGHAILIVLPNFFKLHEDYAISRSLFLIDSYTNKKMERGFFNFYNEYQKEQLYINGKKKHGTVHKYSAVRPSFNGRFSAFLPIDKETYERAKQEAIKQKEVKVVEHKWKKQRDAALYLLFTKGDMNINEIAEELTGLCEVKVSSTMVSGAIDAIAKTKASFIKNSIRRIKI